MLWREIRYVIDRTLVSHNLVYCSMFLSFVAGNFDMDLDRFEDSDLVVFVASSSVE